MRSNGFNFSEFCRIHFNCFSESISCKSADEAAQLFVSFSNTLHDNYKRAMSLANEVDTETRNAIREAETRTIIRLARMLVEYTDVLEIEATLFEQNKELKGIASDDLIGF